MLTLSLDLLVIFNFHYVFVERNPFFFPLLSNQQVEDWFCVFSPPPQLVVVESSSQESRSPPLGKGTTGHGCRRWFQRPADGEDAVEHGRDLVEIFCIKKKEGKWRLFEVLTHKEKNMICIILDYVDIIYGDSVYSMFYCIKWCDVIVLCYTMLH